MKRTFRTELACVFGIVFVARGVVLMEKADFAFPWWSRLHTFFTVGCLPCGASSPSAWRNTACRLCCCSPYARCCGTDGRGVKCLASLCAGAQREKLPRFVRRAAEAVK